MIRSFVFTLATVLAVSCQPQIARADTFPNTVFLNGKVLTVDENFSQVEAIAVTGNKISALGTTEEIAALAGAEALIAHTRSNAYLTHKEDILGSLEVGKLVDIVVIDRDYMTVPVEDIRNLKSVLTMVDGRVVYDAM